MKDIFIFYCAHKKIYMVQAVNVGIAVRFFTAARMDRASNRNRWSFLQWLIINFLSSSPFALQTYSSKIIRKRQVHNNRVPKQLHARGGIASHQIIGFIPVIFPVFEGKPHPENALWSFRLPAVGNIGVFVGNPLVLFRNEEHLLGRFFYHIADRLRL